MDERLELPATFDCTRLRARVTDSGCSRMWTAAHDPARQPKPWESRAACIGCPVGASKANADLGIASAAARARQVEGVCARCGASGRRMVARVHCISCYNRLREASIGKDARGRPPRHAARLFSVALIIERPGLLPVSRTWRSVTSRPEAILAAALATAGDAISIGWSRLAELPGESQPELALFAPRKTRPRRPRAPSCPVSIMLPDYPHASAA